MRLVLPDGGFAEVLETDGTFVVVQASASSPPGSTLVGTSEDGATYRIKVRGCRRIEESRSSVFRIEGRFVDLTRDQRSALLTNKG